MQEMDGSARFDTPPASPRRIKTGASIDSLDYNADDKHDDEPAIERSRIASLRWQLATSAVIASSAAEKEFHNLNDKRSAPADRLFAAVRLEMYLSKYPGRVLLEEAIRRKRMGGHRNLLDRVLDELFITGELIFLWLTPAKMNKHWPIISLLLSTAFLITFFFMAGEYGLHQAQYGCQPALIANPATADTAADIPLYVPRLGPRHLFAVLSGRAGRTCEGTDTGLDGFNGAYLVLWGAQWAPALAAHETWRWWSTQFVHVNFRHVLANTLLLLLLGVQMERKYGSARLLLLWSLAVLGGGLLSVAADDPCKVVAGASGGVFGLVGLYAADLVRNYRTVKRPILQAAVVAALLVWLAVMAGGSRHGVSNMTHVGGLIWGLVPGLLFLNPGEPHWELVEAWATVLGGVAFVALAVALPTHVYLKRLPHVLELCAGGALIEP